MLALKNISYKYFNKKNKNTVSIFNDFNIQVNENEFISFVGPSGCGKTTLINLIAGYLQPASGEISLNDTCLRKPGRNRVVINQMDDLFFWLTVRQNMNIATSDELIVKKYLTLLKLEGKENLYPQELSGGMKKRLSLARALATNSNFILMDEPFSAFDYALREKLHLELLSLKQKTKKTFILVTHDVEEALFLSDRIIVLNSDLPATVEQEFIVDYGEKRELELKEKEDFIKMKNEILKHFR